MAKVTELWLFSNGMVMAFDEKGEQVVGCQGFILDIADAIAEYCDSETKWFMASREGSVDANWSWWFRRREEQKPS